MNDQDLDLFTRRLVDELLAEVIRRVKCQPSELDDLRVRLLRALRDHLRRQVWTR